jgi:predicted nucleic-acid-binding protein
VFVNPIVLAEFAWTLRRTFKLDRAAVCDRLASIAEAIEFKLAYPEAIGRAVKQYETGAADFSDYLNGELNAVFGCDATLTFDKAVAKNPASRHLPFEGAR